MATAADLPTELIEHIFSFATTIDIATCAAVCRVNKMSNKLATPLLYRCIGIPTEMSGTQDRSHRLQALCLTLLARPDLIQFVEELHQVLDEDMHVWKPTPFTDTCHSSQWDVAFSEYFWYFKLPNDRRGFSDNRCLIMLLMMCDGLSTLKLTGNTSFLLDIRYLHHMARVVQSQVKSYRQRQLPLPRSGLNAMRNLILYPTATLEPLVLSTLYRSLGQSNLETIHAHSLTPSRSDLEMEREHELGQDARTDNCAVQNLILTDYAAGSLNLKWIFADLPTLTTISVHWAAGQVVNRRHDWAWIGAYLRLCKMLTAVEFKGGSDPSIAQPGQFAGFGLLRGLTQLRKLQVPRLALLGTANDSKNIALCTLMAVMQTWQQLHAAIPGSDNTFTMADESALGTISDLLPDSLEDLSISCEDATPTQDDCGFLTYPGLAQVREVTMQSSTDVQLASMHHGELRQ